MIGSGDDVDRLAPNPNRITQPFDEIGVDQRRTAGGLTKGQIVERLKGLERRDYYIEEMSTWGGGGLEWMPSEHGPLVHWSYIDAIIKEAECE